MDARELAKTLVSTNVSAVVITHLYGQAAEIEAIVAVCHKHKIPLIEDCAQAHGAIVNERKVGSFGTVGCFSFYPTKNLGALGDGGAVITNEDSVAQSIRELRQYGWDKKYRVALVGGQNSRLDEIQAAILRKKLALLDGWNEERRQIARAYTAALAKYVETPTITESSVAHLYVIQSDKRDLLKKHLTSTGIATDIHYPIPDHQQPAYRADVILPNTEYLARTCLSLPCYPGMPQQHVDRVIDQVCEFFKSL
jgi:dTDP-4-amino-4,6-dideoxygalactose transaminase